jgi:hypothetical protein
VKRCVTETSSIPDFEDAAFTASSIWRQSLALAKLYRKAKTMTLILVRFRFLPRTFGWAFGAALGSRIALSRNPSLGEFQSARSSE